MARRRERQLLVLALAVGLAGTALTAVVKGATFAAGPGLTLPRVSLIWLQLALAAFGCHAALVRRGSDADQTLLPISLALTGLGLTILLSLHPALLPRQVMWLWLSLAVLFGVLAGIGDLPALGRYTYLYGLATVGLLLVPMAFAREINGARLWVHIGGFSVQPSELAKIALVLFAAAYLSGPKGELLAEEPTHWLGLTLPDPRYLGPLLLVWAVSMVMHVALRDLGTAALFFGTFTAMLYAATANSGFVTAGLASFAAGAYLAQKLFHHVHSRLAAWRDPWSDSMIKKGGYQIAQALFAIGAGGLTGVGLGFGQMGKVPAAETDLPFAAICEELGWWGAAAVLALYACWVHRAFRIALRQRAKFCALLALGLGCLMGLQVLVISAGVSKLIPLTGITLPFVSYGGSSLVSSFIVLGLVLRASEGAVR